MQIQDTTPARAAITAPQTTASAFDAPARPFELASAEAFLLLWASMDATQRQRTHAAFKALAGLPLPTDTESEFRAFAEKLGEDEATARTGAFIQFAFNLAGKRIKCAKDAPALDLAQAFGTTK